MIESAEKQYVRISRNFPVSLSFCFYLKFFRKVGNFTRTLWMTVRFTVQVVYGKILEMVLFFWYTISVWKMFDFARFDWFSLTWFDPIAFNHTLHLNNSNFVLQIQHFFFNCKLHSSSWNFQFKKIFCETSLAKNAASNHHY